MGRAPGGRPSCTVPCGNQLPYTHCVARPWGTHGSFPHGERRDDGLRRSECGDEGAYFGIVQMALGLMLNVVCFAVVVSKFQQPRSLSLREPLLCHDGTGRRPTHATGNRRCNLILHPEIHVLFLTPHAARRASPTWVNELQLETVSQPRRASDDPTSSTRNRPSENTSRTTHSIARLFVMSRTP